MQTGFVNGFHLQHVLPMFCQQGGHLLQVSCIRPIVVEKSLGRDHGALYESFEWSLKLLLSRPFNLRWKIFRSGIYSTSSIARSWSLSISFSGLAISVSFGHASAHVYAILVFRNTTALRKPMVTFSWEEQVVAETV